MANVKISELNPLLTVQDADVLPIVDNGVTKKVTAAILQSYTQGNSVLLTGAQTIAGIKTFTSQLASSVATGTAPFSVASTTKVTNLNADLLDGLSSADFQATLSGTGIVKSTAGTISYLTDNSSNWNTAFNDSIVSAAVTGTTTKLLTLNQQDGGTITASWTDDNTDAVTSVFGRTGAVVATSGDYTTTQVTEGTNLYFTDARARAAISLTTTGTSGVATYVSGVLNIPNYGSALSAYVPYTGATTNVDLGVHSLTASDLVINHASGSGVAASISKGGNGEALTVVKSSGSGNAASITGGTTLISELNLTTDLADAYIASAATWNAKQNAITLTTTGTSGAATLVGSTLNIPNYADTDTGITSLNGLTALTQTFAVGTSGTDFGISSSTSTHTFNLPTASATNRGALSSADWTTFNNKQNALTNPITGTGTTNYLPKFTGSSALGNSLVYDNGTNVGIGTTSPSTKLHILSYNSSSTLSTSNTASLVIQNTYGGAAQTGGALFFKSDTGTNNTFAGIGGDLLGSTSSGSYGHLIFGTKNTATDTSLSERMRITSAGNVGIGTTATNGKLQVKSDTNQNLVIGTQGGELSFEVVNDAYSANTPIRYYASTHNWYTGGVIKATLASSGNLLIGTTTDAGFKLDINGTGRVFGTSAGLTIQSTSAGQNAELFFTSTATTWRVGQNIGTATDFEIYNGGTLFKMATSGTATFSGQVNIGNPVAAAVAVASTHKVTVVIGGTTYYLLATT
jgi:hypothetical protein